MYAKTAASKLRKLGFVVAGVETDLDFLETGHGRLSAWQPGFRRISGIIQGGKIHAFKVDGDEPDRPEYDERSSTFHTSLVQAIKAAIIDKVNEIVEMGKHGPL